MTDDELRALAERLKRGYAMSMYATQGDMLLDREGDRHAASAALLSLMEERGALIHDVERHIAIASEEASRAALAEARLSRAVEALRMMTGHYVMLAGSGDCGNWDPEEESHVIAARRVLSEIGGSE